jgi:hypothetical protein
VITAGLYASDDRAVLLDTDNETVSSGGGGGGGGVPGFSFPTVGLALLFASLLGRRRNGVGESE